VRPTHRGLLGLAAALAGGCSYDLDALRGNRDAAVDRPAPVDQGQPPVDTGPRDAGQPDDRPVAERDALTGTCTVPMGMGTFTATPAGTLFDDNTNRTDLAAVPLLATTAGCTEQDADGPMRSRVYRLDVRRTGRLTVTSHTGLCNTFDTRIQLVQGCAREVAQMPLACSDDLPGTDPLRCNTCPSTQMPANTSGCFGLLSTAHFDAVAGDTVFAVVHGYQSARGNFRLWVGENAALVEPFNPMAAFTVNRCACLTAPGTRQAFNFPSSAGLSAPAVLSTGSQGVLHAVAIPAGTYQGVSAQFRVNLLLSADRQCLTATQRRVVLDLFIGSRVITAFSLDVRNRSGIVTVPYTAFQPQNIASPGMLGFELRQRSAEPASGQCLRVEVVPGTDNVVALYQGTAPVGDAGL